jgi:integrase
LSAEEVRSIVAHVKTFHNYAYLSTVYSCGLRLHEGLHLEISDIDS